MDSFVLTSKICGLYFPAGANTGGPSVGCSILKFLASIWPDPSFEAERVVDAVLELVVVVVVEVVVVVDPPQPPRPFLP